MAQSTFIPGRHIMDNIYLAQELMRRYADNKNAPKCTVKIDLRKAYDSVDWDFLKSILHGLNFHPKFVFWVIQCVTTPRFSIAINGSPHGVTTCPWRSWQTLGGILGLPSRDLEEIRSIFGFPMGALSVKYLGVPLTLSKLNIMHYTPLIEKIASLTKKWTCKNLSYAGKTELVRSVLQGVECYWLQVFPLPANVRDRVISICREFLWGTKHPPVSWKELFLPKDEGGLGFRDLGAWNKALLARNLWNIHV
ncbi:uncharacterized protein LOC121770511 [Salvia splendens]|uniref:uncharacterized protein LOC121770511 n=1 Tax=Salvia splendens TaxID=180675 RepID=UPI001C26E947|nr:uncharacterized protein LOC121770511 [Salvia splendens]